MPEGQAFRRFSCGQCAGRFDAELIGGQGGLQLRFEQAQGGIEAEEFRVGGQAHQGEPGAQDLLHAEGEGAGEYGDGIRGLERREGAQGGF